MDRTALIDKINELWPQLKPVPSEQFDPNSPGGIWLRGSERTIDGLPAIDMFMPSYVDTLGIHPDLDKVVTSAGWFCEPNDPGTIMIWR